MPVELRKRKAPEPAPAPAPKKASKPAKAVAKVKGAITGKPAKATSSANGDAAGATASGKPSVGDTVQLDGFGGEVETNDGQKTTLKALVDESKAGVVLFTYPKASTPGCKLSPSSIASLPNAKLPSQAQPKSASSGTPTRP
jgi:peroxiredoxin Q/BCP